MAALSLYVNKGLQTKIFTTFNKTTQSKLEAALQEELKYSHKKKCLQIRNKSILSFKTNGKSAKRDRQLFVEQSQSGQTVITPIHLLWRNEPIAQANKAKFVNRK